MRLRIHIRVPFIFSELLRSLGVRGLGFRVWGLGFRVQGLGFGVWVLGVSVEGLGFGVWGLGFGSLGFRVYLPERLGAKGSQEV